MSRLLTLIVTVACVASTLGEKMDVTQAEMELLRKIRSRRDVGGNTGIKSMDGDFVIQVSENNKVVYKLGNNTVEASAVPENLREYNDATVDALGLGYIQGRDQASNIAKAAAHEIKSDLLNMIIELNETLRNLQSYTSQVESAAAKNTTDLLSEIDVLDDEFSDVEDKVTDAANKNMVIEKALNDTKKVVDTLRDVGLSKDDPIKNCREVKKSGYYWIKPQTYTKEAFQGWCDMRWDGGWLAIVNGYSWQYKQHWKVANARKAYGGVPAPDRAKASQPLSKLSDEQINSYLGMDGKADKKNVYRFSSSCHGPGYQHVQGAQAGWGMYIESTQNEYNDFYSGMNILNKRPKYAYGYGPGRLLTSKWWAGAFRTFDTPHDRNHWQGSAGDNSMVPGNNCWRFFQGHTGKNARNDFSCYNPYSGDRNSERCFSTGSGCNCYDKGNHPQAFNLEIYVKMRADYKYHS